MQVGGSSGSGMVRDVLPSLDAEPAVPEVLGPSDGLEEVPVEGRRNLKLDVMSLEHLMTHFPKNPWCDACQRSRMQQAPAKRSNKESMKHCERFGQCVTADHILAHGRISHGAGGQTDSLVVLGRATG